MNFLLMLRFDCSILVAWLRFLCGELFRCTFIQSLRHRIFLSAPLLREDRHFLLASRGGGVMSSGCFSVLNGLCCSRGSRFFMCNRFFHWLGCLLWRWFRR